VRNGQGAAEGLLGKLKSVAMSIGAAFGAKKIIELTDSMTSTNDIIKMQCLLLLMKPMPSLLKCQ